MAAEIERIEQIVDSRTIQWDIGIACRRVWIGVVVTAAAVNGPSPKFRSMNFVSDTWSE